MGLDFFVVKLSYIEEILEKTTKMLTSSLSGNEVFFGTFVNGSGLGVKGETKITFDGSDWRAHFMRRSGDKLGLGRFVF